MNTAGFFQVHRKIFASYIGDAPPMMFKMFIWFISQAFWADSPGLKRGQFRTTVKDIQEACSYKKGFVRTYIEKSRFYSYIKLLNTHGMITTMNTTMNATKMIEVTVCNYDTYQALLEDDSDTEDNHERDSKPIVPIIDKNNKKGQAPAASVKVKKKNPKVKVPQMLKDHLKNETMPKKYYEYGQRYEMPHSEIVWEFESFLIHKGSQDAHHANWYQAWQTWVRNDTKWSKKARKKSNRFDPGKAQADALEREGIENDARMKGMSVEDYKVYHADLMEKIARSEKIRLAMERKNAK